MASRASNWNHEELRKLVELWADVSIQAIMDSKQKNTRAYDRIKVRLAAAGFIRTVAQINAKIKHLRRLYHKVKDAVQRSGVSADTAEGLCPNIITGGGSAILSIPCDRESCDHARDQQRVVTPGGFRRTRPPLPDLKFIRSIFSYVNTARLNRIGKSDTLPDMVIRHKLM